jgi:hypothetical protein
MYANLIYISHAVRLMPLHGMRRFARRSLGVSAQWSAGRHFSLRREDSEIGSFTRRSVSHFARIFRKHSICDLPVT